MATYPKQASRVRDSVKKVASNYNLSTDLVIDRFRGQDRPRTFNPMEDKPTNFDPKNFSPCLMLASECHIKRKR